MIELKDGAIVYHASYIEIKEIDLSKGRAGLDFGKGFYVTTSYDFVAANRDPSLFPNILNELKSVDIIGGKVANDNTARTLALYTAGAYGEPGEEQTDLYTLNLLLPNRLQNQFCFRSEKAVMDLEFVRGERYGNIK